MEEEKVRGVKIICFGKQGGGTGATTVSVNTMIATMQARPGKYAFIEADYGRASGVYLLNRGLAESLERRESMPTLREYILGQADVTEIIYDTVYPELDLIPGSSFTSEEEVYQAVKDYKRLLSRFDDLVRYLLPRYDMIFIDGPATGTIAAKLDYYVLIPLSELFVPVVTPDPQTIKSTSELIDIAVASDVGYVFFVLNMYKGEERWLRLASEVLSIKPVTVRAFTVRYSQAVEQAYRRGTPVITAFPDDPVCEDYRKIASFILKLQVEEIVEEEKPSRRASKIFSILEYARKLRRKPKVGGENFELELEREIKKLKAMLESEPE